VAQASVSLIPVQITLSGPTDVKLGINIEGADQFWSNGASFPVSTDVPLFPVIQFNPQVVVGYVITSPNDTVISGTVSPDMYKVRGLVESRSFADGQWLFGYSGHPPKIREITFTPSQRPFREPLITMRYVYPPFGYCQPGLTTGACNCIAFNVPECYHSRDSSLVMIGEIRVSARATITTTEGDTFILWSPWSPPIPLRWDVYFQQERR